MKKIILYLVVLLSVQSMAFAQFKNQVPFRAGFLLGAEYTKKDTSVVNVKPYSFFSKYKEKYDDMVSYVAIYITLKKGRSISIYDYMVKDENDKLTPCIAIREEGKVFDSDSATLKYEDTTKRYTLLFPVKELIVLDSNTKSFEYVLISRLLKDDVKLKLPVVNKKSETLSTESKF